MLESCLSTCQRRETLNDGTTLSPKLDVLARGDTCFAPPPIFRSTPPCGRPKLKLRFLISGIAPPILVMYCSMHIPRSPTSISGLMGTTVPKKHGFYGGDYYVRLVGVLRLQNIGNRTVSDSALQLRRIVELAAHVIFAIEAERIVFRTYIGDGEIVTREHSSLSAGFLAHMDTMVPPACFPSCLLNPIYNGKEY